MAHNGVKGNGGGGVIVVARSIALASWRQAARNGENSAKNQSGWRKSESVAAWRSRRRRKYAAKKTARQHGIKHQRQRKRRNGHQRKWRSEENIEEIIAYGVAYANIEKKAWRKQRRHQYQRRRQAPCQHQRKAASISISA